MTALLSQWIFREAAVELIASQNEEEMVSRRVDLLANASLDKALNRNEDVLE